MKLPIKNYNNIIKKEKKAVRLFSNSNPKNFYGLLISRFTAHFKTESVELFFASSLIRKFQAVIAL